MAVPTLAAMAALTLLQHPEAQPLDVTVDYSPFAGFAKRIQRAAREMLKPRHRAATQIQSNYRRLYVTRQLGRSRLFQNFTLWSRTYALNVRERSHAADRRLERLRLMRVYTGRRWQMF